jgi:retron-type reverse transcriptase
LSHIYNYIISWENLLASWQEFLPGKRNKKDVIVFSLRLSDNLLTLQKLLSAKTYKSEGYFAFKINDPKSRDIHKASVRDRLIHHAVYRVLYPYFDRKFIYDSYSCRLGKGTHKALNRFQSFGLKISRNNNRTVWILKGDIRKFFASIDHKILKNILLKYIADKDVFWLLEQIIDSFNTRGSIDKGLPLGNLTSQLLVNIYLNEFDHFIKRQLKIKYYIRYADDFVVFHENRFYLETILPQISEFLESELKLSLHPGKLSIKTFSSGLDFLGWVNFPDHRVLRRATKIRMFMKLKRNNYKEESLNSYLGMISHGNAIKVKRELLNERPINHYLN